MTGLSLFNWTTTENHWCWPFWSGSNIGMTTHTHYSVQAVLLSQTSNSSDRIWSLCLYKINVLCVWIALSLIKFWPVLPLPRILNFSLDKILLIHKIIVFCPCHSRLRTSPQWWPLVFLHNNYPNNLSGKYYNNHFEWIGLPTYANVPNLWTKPHSKQTNRTVTYASPMLPSWVLQNFSQTSSFLQYISNI